MKPSRRLDCYKTSVDATSSFLAGFRFQIDYFSCWPQQDHKTLDNIVGTHVKLVLQISGTADFDTRSTRFSLGPRDCVLVPPYAVYSARTHEGVDIIVDEGTPVLSACNGTITKMGWLTLGGWRIGVEDAFGVYHYYAHLSAYAEGLEIGDTVRAGDVLGFVGSTGYGPVGTSDQMIPHLHFGVYINDVAVNPYPYLRAWDAQQE